MSTIPKSARSTVLERDGNSCLRCGVHISVRGYSLHHRKGRRVLPGLPDPHCPANLVTLCGHGSGPGCHWWVHQHPEESYTDGWMVRRGGDTDPADVPVIDRKGRAWLLSGELVAA